MMNGLLLQGFEWYVIDDGKYYENLKSNLEKLKKLGFTAIWLPPVCKATGTNDVGYGIYDLYDLGEFNQKGSIRTKYGTKEELLNLINKAHELGISIYLDVILNHKAGADEVEIFKAIEVSAENREDEIGEERDIGGWTKFTFPNRNKKYSDFEWNFNHFSGVDYDNIQKKKAIFKISGFNKGWSSSVSNEHGNFDYLMYSDIDHNNADVRAELFKWAKWFINELNADGFRLDAVKHIDADFMDEFIKYIQGEIKKDFYLVGEYWVADKGSLQGYMAETSGNIDLFDVSLHYSFYRASLEKENYDLRKIFDESIVQSNPIMAVTFVDNHDSQKGQSLESWIEDWFRQIAYSLILFRKDGYPCIFYGDLFQIGDGSLYCGMGDKLEKLLELRLNFAYGNQDDYFESPNAIGFVRHGDENHPNKLAVVISNSHENVIRMFVGEHLKNFEFYDYLGNNEGIVKIDEKGFGEFRVSEKSVSAWVPKN
ncbi:alpha-amylase [Peptostreptococcaceae bacterium oral taxon 081]|nr:alpha-amylase [Peptostreptococcaceae bacterium oral taxon 081]